MWRLILIIFPSRSQFLPYFWLQRTTMRLQRTPVEQSIWFFFPLLGFHFVLWMEFICCVKPIIGKKNSANNFFYVFFPNSASFCRNASIDFIEIIDSTMHHAKSVLLNSVQCVIRKPNKLIWNIELRFSSFVYLSHHMLRTFHFDSAETREIQPKKANTNNNNNACLHRFVVLFKHTIFTLFIYSVFNEALWTWPNTKHTKCTSKILRKSLFEKQQKSI